MTHNWWAAYQATQLDLVLPTGKLGRLEQVSNIEGGLWPFEVGHAWIMTAYNPRSIPLKPSENEARDKALGTQLDEAGIEFLRNQGFDPHDPAWSEAGYTLPGADAATVMDLARQWEQNAVFAWYPSRWKIVGVLLDGELTHGWRWSSDLD